MSLPAWVEELKIGNNCGKAYDALTIAWEAMEKHRIRPDGWIADTMRRIESLGESK